MESGLKCVYMYLIQWKLKDRRLFCLQQRCIFNIFTYISMYGCTYVRMHVCIYSCIHPCSTTHPAIRVAGALEPGAYPNYHGNCRIHLHLCFVFTQSQTTWLWCVCHSKNTVYTDPYVLKSIQMRNWLAEVWRAASATLWSDSHPGWRGKSRMSLLSALYTPAPQLTDQ